jgi:hypothetical protein
LDEVASTAFYAGQPLVGHAACMKLLKENRVPQAELERVQGNLRQYEQILAQMQKEAHEYQNSKNIPEKVEKKKKYKEKRK